MSRWNGYNDYKILLLTRLVSGVGQRNHYHANSALRTLAAEDASNCYTCVKMCPCRDSRIYALLVLDLHCVSSGKCPARSSTPATVCKLHSAAVAAGSSDVDWTSLFGQRHSVELWRCSLRRPRKFLICILTSRIQRYYQVLRRYGSVVSKTIRYNTIQYNTTRIMECLMLHWNADELPLSILIDLRIF